MLHDAYIGPPKDGELQVALATDAGFAPRIEVAVCSLLEHLSCPVRIVLICSDDAKGAFPRLEAFAKGYPDARVEYVFPDFLSRVAENRHERFAPASFGRMLIPHLMSGRVLYMDGDVLVRRDLASARDLDLGGNPVAATTDITFLRNVRRAEREGQATTDKERRSVARAVRAMKPYQGLGLNFQDYYNSGVMIFDCDAIREDAELMEQCLDYKRSIIFPTYDQDLINLLFAGRIKKIDQSWNAWTRVSITSAAPFTAVEQADCALARKDPKIIHYYGRIKPWSKLHYRHFTQSPLQHIKYLRYERSLNRRVG